MRERESLKFDVLDLTFITNKRGKTPKDKFNVLIKDARFFDCLDCLVGYFLCKWISSNI